MTKRLVVANWKMYIESPEEAKKFASKLRRKSRLFGGVEVVIAPSYTLISTVVATLKGSHIKTAGQALSIYGSGAHTGFVSAAMLRKIGATYCIVGHSERRSPPAGGGESEEAIHTQLVAAVTAGLTVILCIGERERDAAGSYLSVIEQQLSSALKNFPKGEAAKLVIAYEPVWAIGKSAEEAMKAYELREMSIFIKKTLADMFERKVALRVPILYGGSVEDTNAHTLIADGNVGGFLVGHASTEVNSFVEILKACKK